MTLVALATARRSACSAKLYPFTFPAAPVMTTAKALARLRNPLIRHSVSVHVLHHTSPNSLHCPFNSAIHLPPPPLCLSIQIHKLGQPCLIALRWAVPCAEGTDASLLQIYAAPLIHPLARLSGVLDRIKGFVFTCQGARRRTAEHRGLSGPGAEIMSALFATHMASSMEGSERWENLSLSQS